MNENNNQIKEMKDSFKSIVDGFKKKLQGEVRNSISKLKGSYFDDPQ